MKIMLTFAIENNKYTKQWKGNIIHLRVVALLKFKA